MVKAFQETKTARKKKKKNTGKEERKEGEEGGRVRKHSFSAASLKPVRE